jgi:hypothetical protein
MEYYVTTVNQKENECRNQSQRNQKDSLFHA